MLETHEKFRIIDKNNRSTGVILEVNWNPDDEKTNKCQVIKMTYDNKEYFVDRNLFLEFVFAIGRPEDQQKMVPQKIYNVKWYETVLGITATKDIKKGEKINVPIKLTLPAHEQDTISDVRRPSGSSNLIVPQ